MIKNFQEAQRTTMPSALMVGKVKDGRYGRQASAEITR
jgi:hypothetical protein